MRFDLERLSKLAGVSTGTKTTLTEASNRSYHDGVVSDTDADRFGKNQLAESEDDLEERQKYGGNKRDISATDPGDEDYTWREGSDEEENPEPGSEDVVLEIDEGMLRKEILRMKSERLEETRLRGAIRKEIRDIFSSLTNDSSWVYGNDKPKNSRNGSVTQGFPGIGFKK